MNLLNDFCPKTCFFRFCFFEDLFKSQTYCFFHIFQKKNVVLADHLPRIDWQKILNQFPSSIGFSISGACNSNNIYFTGIWITAVFMPIICYMRISESEKWTSYSVFLIKFVQKCEGVRDCGKNQFWQQNFRPDRGR